MVSWSFAAAALILTVASACLPVSLRALGFTGLSLAALAIVWQVPLLPVIGGVLATYAVGRVLPRCPKAVRPWLTTVAVVAVVGHMLWAKTAPGTAVDAPLGAGAVLGLSYLTLKLVQHLIDAAAGHTDDIGLLDYLACIFFLPTYPAGPIERTGEFARKLAADPLAWGERVRGVERILLGLGKKLLIADPLLGWAFPVFTEAATASPVALVGAIYGYAIGLYLDFAAYSDIAIGIGALAGIRIRENFDRPFLQPNLAALWQRWHMSLTSWLRDFVFFPLTRRLLRVVRRPVLVQMVGQIVTMVACGLWHGTAWNFAVWGLYHGLGLAAFTLWRQRRGPPADSGVRRAVATVVTFHVFAFGLVLFANDLARASVIVARLLGR